MRQINVEDDPVLAAIKKRLYTVLYDNAGQIILFGSRARKAAERDADYDILLLVKRKSKELEDQVDEIAYEMLERHGAVVTIFVDEIAAFEREQGELLFSNIRREGAVL
jgi:predicted nucleotidyltransferase